jgi:hypothetical protein
MGSFIGYDEIGVWASNQERDAFLDWFAENRCAPGDARWDYCKSEAQRWTGRCIELEELIPAGAPLGLTDEEYARAATAFWPEVAQLLRILDSLTRGEWTLRVYSVEAKLWRQAGNEQHGSVDKAPPN